jgi:hypothetical protein
MYKTFNTRYVYEIAHLDPRALTLFLLSFDRSDIEVRIEDA